MNIIHMISLLSIVTRMTLRVTRVVTASILFRYNYFRNIGRLTVFASPIAQLEDGVNATDVDLFTNCC